MHTLLEWLDGNLSANARIWTAIAPALLILSYFLIGTAAYAIRYALKGPYRDAEMEKRPTSPLTALWFRLCFVWVMKPVWALIMWAGIPATALTTLSVLLATGSGVALSQGRFALGGWLYIFAGICDFLDGRVARARNSATAAGAVLDSVLDRYSDAAVLMGLAWFYRDSWVLIVVLAAMAGSSLVPYIRAKGEASGVQMSNVGLMQRAERIIFLGASVAFSPILEALWIPDAARPIHRLAVVGVVLLAVSTQVTALHRLFHLLKTLDGKDLQTSWLTTHRGAIVRNLLAASFATLTDFAFVFVLVKLELAPPPIATLFGCALGGVVNFSLNRIWTFASSDPHLPQIGKYAVVSVTSALLNAGGVALVLLLPGVDYRVAWWLVRGLVFLTWNYPLHREYVFNDTNAASAAPAR